MAAPALVPHTTAKLKNVLFATDFSEGSSRALPYAGEIAKAFGATVHLCHIVTPTPLAAGIAAPELYQAAGEEVAEQLSTLRCFYTWYSATAEYCLSHHRWSNLPGAHCPITGRLGVIKGAMERSMRRSR